MEVGTRVIVDMHGVAYDEQNQWMGKYFNKDVIDHYMFGTIKRHADNGKTGIEFDVEIVTGDNYYTTSDLHGTGRKRYCLYIKREYYTAVHEKVSPQGDIAQSMEDTMLDHEYDMDEDEYMYIVGF